MTEPDDPEGRHDARAPVALRVEYQRLNAFFADYTKNISQGGTFIRTRKPLAIGTEFAFRLFVPMLEEPLHLRGVVQWIVEPSAAKENQEPGMGIGFVHESEADRRRIERVVEELMRNELGENVARKLLKRD